MIDHLFVSPPSYCVAFLEPFSVLAAVAGSTERITIGTGILVLPLRDPVLVAKTLASLDAMSEGRIIFGAGVGWDQRELDACQIDRSSRGQRMDEILEIILGLWREDCFSFSGRHFMLRDVQLEPRPVQQPRPKIWLAAGTVPSGTSSHITQDHRYRPDRGLRRVARYGDTLMSAYRSVPDGDTRWLRKDRERLEQLAIEESRSPSELTHAIQDHVYIRMDGLTTAIETTVSQFTAKPFAEIAPYYLLGRPEEIIPKLQARIDAGITELAINFIDPDPSQLELFAHHIRPHLRGASGELPAGAC